MQASRMVVVRRALGWKMRAFWRRAVYSPGGNLSKTYRPPIARRHGRARIAAARRLYYQGPARALGETSWS